MPTPSDILLENEALRVEIETLKHKLAVSQRWMNRQIQESIRAVSQEKIRHATRYRFSNELERDQLVLLEQSIEEYFWSTLFWAPQKSVERLIDAELQWFHLQKFPQMDGLAIVMSYQKIVDACIEDLLSAPFRDFIRENKILIRNTLDDPIDRDLENLVYKSYTLSIGRVYHILQTLREHWDDQYPPFLLLFSQFLHSDLISISDTLLSDDFLNPLRMIVEMEVFSRKRHEGKVSFSDVKQTRSLLVGNYQAKSALLYQLFTLGMKEG